MKNRIRLLFFQNQIKKYFFLFFILMIFAQISCGSSQNSVFYTNLITNPVYPSTFVTGIRQVAGSNSVYISGGYTTSTTYSLLYQGPLSGVGTWNLITPSSTLSPGHAITSSTLYGPDNSSTAGEVNLVGTYKVQGDTTTYGFFYSGPPNGSGSTWLNLNPSSLISMGDILLGTVPHSTMNGIAVGNFDTQARSGRVFIYNTANSTYYELTKSGTTSISAYGIWWNGGTSYTIAGGYRDPFNPTQGTVGYLVDWDSSTQQATNWQYYNYQNDSTWVTHFEGITTDNAGGYNLAAAWETADSSGAGGAFAHVSRNSDNSFGTATWTNISFPGAATTTVNTVYLNNILGVYLLQGSAVTYPYIATVE